MTVKLRIVGDIRTELVSLPTENTAVWEVGQLISLESGYAVKLDAAAEDASFAGVSMDKRTLGDTYPDVVLCKRGIFEAGVGNDVYVVGDALAYNASTDKLEKSTANTIAWAHENKTGTTLKVLIDVEKLGKLFSVSA